MQRHGLLRSAEWLVAVWRPTLQLIWSWAISLRFVCKVRQPLRFWSDAPLLKFSHFLYTVKYPSGQGRQGERSWRRNTLFKSCIRSPAFQVCVVTPWLYKRVEGKAEQPWRPYSSRGFTAELRTYGNIYVCMAIFNLPCQFYPLYY